MNWKALPQSAPTLASLADTFSNLNGVGSKSTAVGAVFVMNEVSSGASATVVGATLSAGGDQGGIILSAVESAALEAFVENNITSSGGSAFSSKDEDGSLAASGSLVTNLVNASATATVDDDSFGHHSSLTGGGGGVSVTADNAAQMDATALVASSTSGGASQKAVGLILAFNALGYRPENFLFNSIDALLGSDYLSTATPSNATAFIHNANMADSGDLTVQATSSEQINATNSNAATSTASALFDATGASIGGSLASNKVDGSALAYIDESGLGDGPYSITLGGSLTVQADNKAGIYSNVKLVSSSSVTNDGGAGLLQNAINNMTAATYVTDANVATPNKKIVDLVFGDTVRLASDYVTPTNGTTADGGSLPDIIGSGAPGATVSTGDVVQFNGTLYRYLGKKDLTVDFSAQASASSLPTFTDTTNWAQIGGNSGLIYKYVGPGDKVHPVSTDLHNTDYSNPDLWQQVLSTQVVPQGLSVTDSDSKAAGAIVVLNDVTSNTTAYVNKFGVAASGTISVVAVDEATITAQNDSTVTDSGGSAMGAGDDMALNGVIATNVVQGGAKAYVQSSVLSTSSVLHIAGSGLAKDNVNAGDVVEVDNAHASSDLTTTPQQGSVKNSVVLVGGETVRLAANYDTAGYIVGEGDAGTTLQVGDVVNDHGVLYRYIGPAITTVVDFSNAGESAFADLLTSSPQNWAQIGGDNGALYQYVGGGDGADSASTDINNTDYTDTTKWLLVPTRFYRYDGAATQLDLSPKGSPFNFTANGWSAVNLGTLSIFASDTSTITATNSANTTMGGDGGGVALAFNTIGWQASNVLFSAVSGLIGSPSKLFSASNSSGVTAYADSSPLTAKNGSVAVNAVEQATISANASNVTSALGAAFKEDSKSAYGAIVATNMVNADASASLTSSPTTAGQGSLTVAASNDAEIQASDDQEVTAKAMSTPQGLILSYLNQILSDYTYTASSGTQIVSKGDLVYVGASFSTPTYNVANDSLKTLHVGDTVLAGNNFVYRYEGTDGAQVDLSKVDFPNSGAFTLNIYKYASSASSLLDLGKQTYANNTNVWSPVTYGSLLNSIPTVNLTETNATSVGAIFVLNDVRGDATATVTTSVLSSSGDLTISADNNATITAANTSTIIASGGSPFAGGNATAVNVAIASNYVLSSTIASAVGSSLTSTAGSVSISAFGNASIDAQMDASATANSSSIGVVLAFNAIGMEEPDAGLFVAALDATFGTSLTTENPALVQAFSKGSYIDAHEDVSIAATDASSINSEVRNSALSVPSTDSLAAGNGVSIGATIALNHIATTVAAYVDGTPVAGSVAPSLMVKADAGDIQIASSETGSVVATVVTPVVKFGLQFKGSGASTGIGVSIARNLIDGKASAYDTGENLTASNGGVAVNSSNVSTNSATSASAAVSISVAPSGAGSFSGGGATAENIVGAVVSAYIVSAALVSNGDLSVKAKNVSMIDATVATLAAAVAASATSGVGGTIGVAYAHNVVSDGTSSGQGSVEAYLSGVSSTGLGGVDVEALSQESITAMTLAGAAALSGGGTTGVGVSGAGVFVSNDVNVATSAYIDGGGTSPIAAASLTVVASDAADITSTAGAASVAGGFGGTSGVAASIGLSIASNTISDPVTAYVSGLASLLTGGGAISVSATEDAAITATTVAAAVSLGMGGTTGVALSGGGATAENLITTSTIAYISGSSLGDATHLVGDVSVLATDTANLTATVAAVAASVTFGGSAGVGAAIGVSLAHNRISDGTADGAGAVKAYIYDSSISASGRVDVEATSAETISAITVAAAAALAGGGAAGVGLSGAGVSDKNENAVQASAYIDGDGQSLTTGGVTLVAKDISTITATVGAASVAGAIGGTGGVAASIGVSIAQNAIKDDVRAYILDVAKLFTGGGSVSVTATEGATIKATATTASLSVAGGGVGGVGLAGGGASATNSISINAVAYIQDSSLGAANNSVGAVAVTASNRADIEARIAAVSAAAAVGATGGVGAAIGVSTAQNTILGSGSASAQIYAYISGGSIYSSGAINVGATSSGSITALVEAGAAALAGGGVAGVGLSYGGAFAYNETQVSTRAYIDGAGSTPISASSVSVAASDTANITADVETASVGAAVGGVAGVNVSISMSVARNTILDDQQAYVTGVASLSTGTGAVSVTSTANATIASTAFAAGVSVALGGAAGVGVSGAATTAENLTKADVRAYIANTTITAAGAITVSASDTSRIKATISAASIAAAGGGVAGVGVAVGAAMAHNAIGDGSSGAANSGIITAYLDHTSTVATGALAIAATSNQTITATVDSLAAALAAGGFVGGAASGAGASAVNDIKVNIASYIDGDAVSGASQTGVKAGSVTPSGNDTSEIAAVTGAAALSAALGTFSGSISVGVALATNRISNDMEVYVDSAANGVASTSGAIALSANEGATISATSSAASLAASGGVGALSLAGAGAEATNVILNNTNAYFTNSVLTSFTDITATATATATINANVVAAVASGAAGVVAGAASLGAAISRNFIGYDANGNEQSSQVRAYSSNASMSAAGAFNETATSHSTINAAVNVASAAITVAGVGASAAGSGATANNEVSIDTEATVNQSGATGISAGSLTLDAQDTSTIATNVSASSMSATAGLGAAVSVGVSEAVNIIDNTTEASITSANVTTTTGDAMVKAIESATISASSVASSSSAGLAAASGGGATATNTITTNTSAYVDSSTLTIDGKLWIDAEDQSTATATTGSSSIAAGFISFAGGGSGATSTINNTVTARIGGTGSDVTAGTIEVDASAAPEGKAVAYGVAAGSLAVGASVATVTLTPVVSSTVGGSIHAAALTVNAKLNLPSDGHAAADASAFGAVGALIGVTASNANATNHATVTAGVASAAVVVVSGAIAVSALSATKQTADGSNVALGLIAAGAAVATAHATNITKAVIGSGASVTGGSLGVNATGNDDDFAQTFAGSGGVLAGAAAAPTSDDDATTTALIDASAIVDLTGQGAATYLLSNGMGGLTLGAAHTAVTNTQVTATGVGLLSGSGAESNNNVVSTVTASFGDSSNVKALSIQGASTNTVLKPALGRRHHSRRRRQCHRRR